MFYHNFVDLCNKRNISPSAAAENMGFHRSDVTRWSKGAQPRQATIQKIADYFDVPVSALTSENQKEKPPAQSGEQNEINAIFDELTPDNRSKLLELARLYLDAQRKNAGKK